MTKTTSTGPDGSRGNALRTSVSLFTLTAASSFLSLATAQTVILDGDNVTVTSQADGETISAAAGVTSTVDGAPVVIFANDDVVLDNAATLATINGSQTVQISDGTTGGIINNAATGVLNGDSRVVQIDGDSATLNNDGNIIGTGDQRNGTVYTNRTATDFTLNNTATGTIDAGAGNLGAGASFEGVAEGTEININNAGTIQGRGNAGAGAATAGDGIRFERTRVAGALDGTTSALFTGTLENSGTIASEGANGTVGGVRFVNGVSFAGEINNSGTITGAQNGLYFGNATPAGGGDFTAATVNNSGTISSGSRALNIDGEGLTVNNSGQIIGLGNQRNGTVYADSTAQNLTLNNLETGVIDAGAGNEGAGFSVELSEVGNAFDIVNDGTIQGRGNAGAGLATAGDGIRLERERVAGALDATTTGLFTGTITNNGTIASEGANGTVGGFRAVNGVSFQGTLDNNGTISGVQNGVYFGNPTPAGGGDHTGGVVNNNTGGVISSDSRAFNIDGIGLEINNAGTILATGTQRNGTVYADSTAQNFTLNNLEGGIIDAGDGLEGAAFSVELSEEGNAFDINNDGTIQGRGQAAAGATAAGDGLRFERTRVAGVLDGTTTGLFTGNITNTGTIASESAQGTTAGIRFVNGTSFSGTIDNSGTISGVQNGLYFGNATPAGGGDFTGAVVNNSGTISSDSRALNIDGTGLEVNNSGSILGTGNQRNGTVYADSTAQNFVFNNLEGGLIDAGAGNEGSGFGHEIAADGNTFTLVNAGTIQGRGNAAAGENGAGDGVRIGNVGNIGTANATISNTGTIASEGANGTVAGVRFVNGISFAGTFDNSGTISGVQNGVYFGNPVAGEGADHSDGVFNNLEGGLISSDSRAFNIDGIGLTVNNAGTILATGTQRNGTVYADSTAQDFTLNNTATGVIDAGEGLEGAGFSVELAETGNTFAINNDGQILGRGQAGAGATAAGDGLRFERTRVVGALDGSTTGLFDGTITNTGTISSESTQGTTAGIRFVNGTSFQGEINNSGAISGVQNGLYFGNAVPAGGAVNTGVVNNLAGGVISSDSRAVNIDGTGLTLNNAGSILGTGNQRNGTVYADATADNYTINNQTGGVIDAGVGNQGSGVSLQSGDVDGDTVTLALTNAGTIAGRGDALASGATAGVRVFAGSTNVTVNGDITNTGTITSETAPALLIEGVNYTGTITNQGVLAGTAAFDASAALGAINFVNNGGTLNGNFVGSSFADTLAFQGASTLAGSILGGVETSIATDAVTTVSGAQTLEGNLTADGALSFVLGADSLAVDGNTTFNAGSVVNIATAGDLTALTLGQPISVISEIGTFTDNGLAVNLIDNDFLLDFDVELGSVTVTASATDLAAVSADPNVSAFGGAVTAALVAGQLDADVGAALNSAADTAAFEQASLSLLPSINEGVTREVYEAQGQVDRYVERRLQSEAPRGVWAQGFGRTADRDAESTSVVGYDATSFGFAIGADAQVNEQLTVGAAFNYANIDIDSEGSSLEETSIDSLEASLYAGYQQGAAFFNGQVGYIFGDASSTRTGASGVINGDFDVKGFNGQFTTGYDIENGDWTFTPQAGLRFASLSRDDYTEAGGLNLDVDADSVQYLDARIGANVAGDFEGFQPFARASYVYDLIGDETVLNASFAGATPFTLNSDDPAQSRFEIGTGFNWSAGTGFTIGIEYDGEFASGYQSHGGSVRVRYAF